MTVSDIIQIVSIVCASILSVIAIVISFLTLRQNNKMIFESNKPYISIFSKVLNFTSPHQYLVLKNFGRSGATIQKIECDTDLTSYFEREPFKNMNDTFIAPNQTFLYPVETGVQVKTTISFKVYYEYLGKSYIENHLVCFNQYNDTVFLKTHITDSADIKEMSEVLQEMTIQNI